MDVVTSKSHEAQALGNDKNKRSCVCVIHGFEESRHEISKLNLVHLKLLQISSSNSLKHD